MAQDITVIMKDGYKETFRHTGRAGGSWTKEIRNETAIPSADIIKIEIKKY